MKKTPIFFADDLVVFRQDSEHRTWVVVGPVQGAEGSKVSISLLSNPGHVEDAYTHLIVLAEPIMQFFRFGHLPKALQDVSAPFCFMARSLVAVLPRNPERTVALRKLLEAKDAAVRAALYEG